MRRKYSFKPTGIAGIHTELPEVYLPSMVGTYRNGSSNYTQNYRTFQGSARARWGYATHWTDTDGPVLNVGSYIDSTNNTWYTVILTPHDIILPWAAGTYYWMTPTKTYTTTSQVDSIDAATKLVVTFEGATTLLNDAVKTHLDAGKKAYFILDEDHTSGSEPDADWREISSIDSNTQLTLASAYGKAVTSPGSKDARIRRAFDGPSNSSNQYDLWNWASINGTFVFCNANDDVMMYQGDSTTTDALDSTNAKNFKYCIKYAERLILANTQETGSQDPLLVKWSKNGDATDWTDSTAGSVVLQSPEKEITGLGVLGNTLLVFTSNSIIFGNKTGEATAPIIFPTERRGIGAYAPYSIIHADGSVFFMGRNDFYRMDGQTPVSIGQAIRDEVHGALDDTSLKYFIGTHNYETGEVWWFESHTQTVFAYDYVHQTWNVYNFADTNGFLHGGGMSAGTNFTTNGFYFGTTNTGNTTHELQLFSSASTADGGGAIATSYRTRKTDFSDRDPEAGGRWKNVHRVRLTYRDNVANTPYALYVYKDDTLGSIGTNTVGTGSGEIKTTDWTFLNTANFWEFRIYCTSTTHKPQIVGIEVFYELGGMVYTI